MLKATKVDGVYTADPKKDPTATRYNEITFDEAIVKNLKVMDATALTLCRDQKLPINVFRIFKPGALQARGDGRGRRHPGPQLSRGRRRRCMIADIKKTGRREKMAQVASRR